MTRINIKKNDKDFQLVYNDRGVLDFVINRTTHENLKMETAMEGAGYEISRNNHLMPMDVCDARYVKISAYDIFVPRLLFIENTIKQEEDNNTTTEDGDDESNWGLTIPTNLDEAFACLDHWAGGKDKFLAADGKTAMAGAHHSIGQYLRNEWGLWSALGDDWDEPTPLVKWFMDTYKVKHADDISSIILLSYHRHKNSKPLNIESQIKKYHDHWKKHDPKMLEM
jgi:Domain of unknown function (DUF6794)